MLVKLSSQEIPLIKEALNYKGRSDLIKILENDNKTFELTDDQLIDMDDCCKDYFCFVGLDDKQEANEKGLVIERLIDKIYGYLENYDSDNR
jgi:hypothetical protein